MPLDLKTALNSYGFWGQLALAIPDLKKILAQAQAGNWVPEQFNRAVMDSPWYKTNAESLRQLQTLRATDPATYNQNVGNAQSKVAMIAREMGLNVPGGVTSSLALLMLTKNFDEEQIRRHMALTYGVKTGPNGQLYGDAAQLGTHMRELAANYGVAYSDAFVNQQITQIQRGENSLDGFESLMRARAKAQYPHLAAQIDAGMTVRDIADPYIATYAQTLEVPETGIKLNDPRILKALQVKDPKSGALSNQPMYEFQRQLKDDPRWDRTKNAQEEAYRMVSRLGKDMGFLS